MILRGLKINSSSLHHHFLETSCHNQAINPDNPESNVAISTQAIIISTLFTTNYLVHKTIKEISGKSFKVVLADVLAFQIDDFIETKTPKRLRTIKLMLIVTMMAFNGLNNMITIISVIGYILLTVSEFKRYHKIFKERETIRKRIAQQH